MDCSPPGSSVHGSFQARALAWGATAFSHPQLCSDVKKPRKNQGEKEKRKHCLDQCCRLVAICGNSDYRSRVDGHSIFPSSARLPVKYYRAPRSLLGVVSEGELKPGQMIPKPVSTGTFNLHSLKANHME
ncbi:hypothetical protein CapIbe_024003 [Capra ibex]